MQLRVIDTIELRDSWTDRYPDWAQQGEAVIAVIDPFDRVDPAGLIGRDVRVLRPDGTSVVMRVDRAESPSGTLGLFFPGRSSVDVPRGSTITW